MPALDLYRAKRDFSKTTEPRGKRARAKPKALRFVIQRHDATRLHYDLRLELDGVYKSWAVTKVPSLDPGTKRLAVEVEDHPIEYGTFEGVIPEGEYGGGTVQLWDRGTWRPEAGHDALRDLQKGHLAFEIGGKRLRGGWALIRMRDRSAKPGRKTRHNWLLIKERDAYAAPGDSDALLAEDTSVATGRTLDEIAGSPRKKVWNSSAPPRAAVDSKKKDSRSRKETSAKPVLTSAKLPDFVPPQLCRLVKVPPSGADWVHEVKFDGYRMQLRVASGKARLRTRTALDWSARFPEIVAEGARLPDGLIDGEICALNEEGIPDFTALQAALSDGRTERLVYFVFDLLFLGNVDVRAQALSRRKELLSAMIAGTARIPHLRYVEHFASAGGVVLESSCRAGLEGVVSKRLDTAYMSGRGGAWTKAKCRGGQEIVIGGWWGDARILRSLLVGAYRGKDFVYMGRIGTGFHARNAGPLLKALRPLERKTSPFTAGVKPPRVRGVHWVEPVLVAEVEFASLTSDGLLRQASFKALRTDKPARAIVPETVEDPADDSEIRQRETLMPRTRPQNASRKSAGTPVVASVAISHPDKVLWPAAATGAPVTKLDLARYYEMAAPVMLPHIAGRPLSLVRAPDGIGGERFFQRHVLSGVAAEPIAVAGEKKPFHALSSVEGLVALAQAAVLEIHPWGSRRNDPETPDRLIFDLDPDAGLPFARVIEGAKEMRARLEALGLAPFVKTTGGKGIHVVVPIAGKGASKPTWPDAKAFARALCERMVRDSPDRYVATMSKARRAGKIFLDYLRNDRMATAVAAWSPRAREGATVATPLAWSQVKSGLDPQAFTIWSVPARLKRSDPWADFARAASSMAAARKKFA